MEEGLGSVFAPRVPPAKTPSLLDQIGEAAKWARDKLTYYPGSLRPPGPLPNPDGGPALTAYNPSLRERIAAGMMGQERPSPEKSRFVTGAMGTSGTPGSERFNLVDATPLGTPLALDELRRAGESGTGVTQAAANVFPGAKMAKAAKGAKGAAKGVASAFDGANFDPNAFKTDPNPSAKFPQYAEEYPPVGPPVEKLKDPKKPELGVYDAKQLTPEAELFAEERKRIMKDMETNGYQPYFPKEERFYSDPSNYPPNTVTAESALPKKQATIDQHTAWIDTPQVRQNLRDAAAKGGLDPEAVDWYALGQLEQDLTRQLGVEEGRNAFLQKFATSMAATTGGADPAANFMMAMYGNYLREHGLEYPVTHQMPYPIGGRYAKGNMDMHEKVFDNGGFSFLGANNPKRHDFAQSLVGNPDTFTVDEQMTSGMMRGAPTKEQRDLKLPPGDTYGIFTQVGIDEARKAGMRPAEFQGTGWAGFKDEGGKPMIDFVNDAIERTHRLTGMPREEIVRRGIGQSQIPIYGLGAAATLPLLPMIQPGEDQPPPPPRT